MDNCETNRDHVVKDLRYLKSYGKVSKNQTIYEIAESALELLKEQDAVKPIITPWAENEDGEVVIAKRECGKCGYQFFTEEPNFCENCGVPILWEGRRILMSKYGGYDQANQNGGEEMQSRENVMERVKHNAR